MTGYIDSKEDHLKRLRRIEGQVRGLQRLVDEDQYCIDILDQVSAVSKALDGFAVALLNEHLNHCVIDAVSSGDVEQARAKAQEATAALAKLAKMR